MLYSHWALSATQRVPPPLLRCLSHTFSSMSSIHCLLISRPTAPFASGSKSATSVTQYCQPRQQIDTSGFHGYR